MIETERIMDKLINFGMEDMFSADKRTKHGKLIANLCKLWVSIGKDDLDTKWNKRVERFGQFIDAGLERLDTYHEYIIKELEDEANNNN